MAAPQFLPIPKNIHALACETINRRVNRLPFTQDGMEITGELVAVAMECLNAEVLRTLPLKTLEKGDRMVPGLGDCLQERLGGDQGAAAAAVAQVLTTAGLTEPAEVLDTKTHTKMRGIRLLSVWTWHIGSGDRGSAVSTEPAGSAGDAWLARCPVCRTGILNRVTGKRLFGIPPTDYYLDCSHCGAKFVPEKNRFRLVSIAHISDPRWRQHLNSAKSADDWAVLASREQEKKPAPASRVRTTGYRLKAPKPEAPPVTAPVHRPARPAREIDGAAVSFSALRDGTLAVPGEAKTLYFRPVALQFLKSLRHDLFTQSKRTVKEALEQPAFSSLVRECGQELAKYQDSRLGQVMADFRLRSNMVYRRFLNAYGEEDFSSFCIADEETGHARGILMVYAKGRICHIAGCHTGFSELIDRGFGALMSDACYRDGDETACRINCIVTTCRPDPVIYIHAVSDDTAIDALVAALTARYLSAGPAPQEPAVVP
jgi:hypothetical protein